MSEKHDGWVVKYSWGTFLEASFRPTRTEVVAWWNKDAESPCLKWKNMSRRYGHKIVKVKLVEVDK